MTDVHDTASMTAGSDGRALRQARLLRAAALLIAGIVIAFTATLHRDPVFDRWVLCASLAVIGLTTVFEFFALRATPASWLVATRATVALVAAAALLVSQSVVDTAIVVAIWAALSVVIAVIRVSRGGQAPRIGVPSALLSGVLAVLVLIFREDMIAVIGFFGAYAIVRGVFLGISAFDTRHDPGRAGMTDPSEDDFAPEN